MIINHWFTTTQLSNNLEEGSALGKNGDLLIFVFFEATCYFFLWCKFQVCILPSPKRKPFSVGNRLEEEIPKDINEQLMSFAREICCPPF